MKIQCNTVKFIFMGVFLYTTVVYWISSFVIPLTYTPSGLWKVMMSNSSRDSSVSGLGTIGVDVTKIGKFLKQKKMSAKQSHSIHKKHKKTDGMTIYPRDCISNNQNRNFGSVAKPTKFECSHFMTLTENLGRTGNQMFQVSALLGTAYYHGYTPIIPPSFTIHKMFDLPNVMKMNVQNTRKFQEIQFATFNENIRDLENSVNWTLSGYLQSWKYFKGADKIIRKSLKVKQTFLDAAQDYLNQTSRTGYQNVCAHVRRGDMNMPTSIKKGYAISGVGFIYRAMEFYRNKFKQVQFIVISDGMEWCKSNIKAKNVLFSPFLRVEDDFALMTICDHVIVTSGTFGWWGAWLSGGTTVYFRGFPRKRSWMESQLNRKDYYPKHWIGMY